MASPGPCRLLAGADAAAAAVAPSPRDDDCPASSRGDCMASKRGRHRPMPPPPPLAAARRRVTLVRLPSGRHAWWMENAISSTRTEAMLRRRMRYFEEEAARKNAAAARALGNDFEESTGDTGRGTDGGHEPGGIRWRRPSADSITVSTSEPAFCYFTPSIGTSESSSFEKKKQRPGDGGSHEVFIDDGNCIGQSGGGAALAPSPSREVPEIRVCQGQARARIGETVRGEIDAHGSSFEKNGEGFNALEYIQLEPSAGGFDMIDAAPATAEEKCAWGPAFSGAEDGDAGRNVHSVAIGEETCTGGEEFASNDHEYSIRSSNLMDSNLISYLTDLSDCSRGGNVESTEHDSAWEHRATKEKEFEGDPFGTSSRGARKGEPSAEMVTGEEGDDMQSMKTEGSVGVMTCNGAAMVSLELSLIEEVDDNGDDGDGAQDEPAHYIRRCDAVRMDPQEANDIGYSLSLIPVEGSGAASAPTVIDEGSPAGTNSYGSSLCDSSRWGFNVTDMFDHLGLIPDKPQDSVIAIDRGRNEMKAPKRADTAMLSQQTTEEEIVASPQDHEEENMKAKWDAVADEKADELSAEMTSAERLRREIEESLHSEATENERFLAEEERARAEITQERLVSKESVNHDEIHCEPADQGVGPLHWDDGGNEAGSELAEVDLPSPDSYTHRHSPSPAESLAECLAHLARSPSSDSDFELQSISIQEHVFDCQPSQGGGGNENQEYILNKMMEQVPDDVDSSSEKSNDESEVGHSKSELNVLIEGVSELEEVTQKQHEYITSPSNHDLETQLDHLNQEIDAIAPISEKLMGLTPKSRPQKNGARAGFVIGSPGQIGADDDQLPAATPEMVHHSFSVERSKENNQPSHLKRDDSSIQQERIQLQKDVEKRANGQTIQPTHNGAVSTIPSTKIPVLMPDKSEHITVIENQLCAPTGSSSEPLPEHRAMGNPPKPQSTEYRGLVDTPKSKLTIKGQRLITKTAARKCYFFKSPRCAKAKRSRRPFITDANKSEVNPSNGIPSETKANQSDAKEKITTYPSPSLGPRELKAYEKHVSSVREQKNSYGSDRDPDVHKTSRNRSAVRLNSPCPRELKAIEKHIRTMRKRLGQNDVTPIISPGALSKVRTGSAYDRHISRMKVKQPASA